MSFYGLRHALRSLFAKYRNFITRDLECCAQFIHKEGPGCHGVSRPPLLWAP